MERLQARRPQYSCSFCGKGQDEVRRLIAGQHAVYICNECVELCREILKDGSGGGNSPRSPKK